VEAFIAYKRNGSLANHNGKTRKVNNSMKCSVQGPRSKTVSKPMIK
jgi:hypothetical protein